MAANGSSNVNFKIARIAVRCPLRPDRRRFPSMHWHAIELKATRMIGGAPAASSQPGRICIEWDAKNDRSSRFGCNWTSRHGSILHAIRIVAANEWCSDQPAQRVRWRAGRPRPAAQVMTRDIIPPESATQAAHPLFYIDLLWLLQLDLLAGARLLPSSKITNANAYSGCSGNSVIWRPNSIRSACCLRSHTPTGYRQRVGA